MSRDSNLRRTAKSRKAHAKNGKMHEYRTTKEWGKIMIARTLGAFGK